MSISPYTYGDFEEWLKDNSEVFNVDEDDELEDLSILRKEFNSKLTSAATLLLGEYLSGCGGTVNYVILTREEYHMLKEATNNKAISYLENKIPPENRLDAHHDIDWSDLQCSLYAIGQHYLLESFMVG